VAGAGGIVSFWPPPFGVSVSTSMTMPSFRRRPPQTKHGWTARVKIKTCLVTRSRIPHLVGGMLYITLEFHNLYENGPASPVPLPTRLSPSPMRLPPLKSYLYHTAALLISLQRGRMAPLSPHQLSWVWRSVICRCSTRSLGRLINEPPPCRSADMKSDYALPDIPIPC
jgi:hypothetical protein